MPIGACWLPTSFCSKTLLLQLCCCCCYHRPCHMYGDMCCNPQACACCLTFSVIAVSVFACPMLFPAAAVSSNSFRIESHILSRLPFCNDQLVSFKTQSASRLLHLDCLLHQACCHAASCSASPPRTNSMIQSTAHLHSVRLAPTAIASRCG